MGNEDAIDVLQHFNPKGTGGTGIAYKQGRGRKRRVSAGLITNKPGWYIAEGLWLLSKRLRERRLIYHVGLLVPRTLQLLATQSILLYLAR